MVRQDTKNILTDSFLELAASKSIEKITIADITKNCGMTNPTFYRHFKDKYDLVAWVYVREVQNYRNKIGQDGYDWEDMMRDTLHFLEKNRGFMVNALKHTRGSNSFTIQLIERNLAYTTDDILKKRNGEPIPDDMMAIIKIFCYGAGQYLCEWLVDSEPASCETMAARMDASVPKILRPYLCE